MALQDNILHDFSTYTYGLKLYGITKEDYNNVVLQTNLDRIHKTTFSKKVIIAESAATSMIIDELSIITAPAVTEGSFFTDITFDITQIKGYSFIESIVAASMILDWTALVQDPIFILEISFKGYRNVTDYDTDIYTVSIPIKIRKVNAEISSTGSKYQIEAGLVYDVLRPDISTIPEQVNVEKKTTFGEFITEFKNQLNRHLKEDNEPEGIEPHEHEFVVDDEKIFENKSLKEFEVSKPNDEDSPIYNSSLDNDGKEGFTEYRFPNSMSIPKAIESVIATSTKAQKLLNPDNNKGIGLSFTIQPIVEIKKFNKSTGDNTLKITWHIKPQKNIIPTRNDMDEKEYLKRLVQTGVIKKSYDYYFTGENTEVLNVDLQLNDIYFNKLSKYENFFINQSRNTPQFRVNKIENSFDEILNKKLDALDDNNPYQVEPIREGDTDIFYVDDIKNLDIKNSRYYNKFIKQYSSSTSSEGSSPEEGGDSKRFNYHLTLHNIRNNVPVSMLSMTMDIRGDPFWLKPAHSVYNETRFGTDARKTFNLIGFFMGYPLEIQENNSKNSSYRTDYMFSGLYQVKTVTSNFNSGKFTQQLTCTRIMDVSGYVVNKELNKTIEENDDG